MVKEASTAEELRDEELRRMAAEHGEYERAEKSVAGYERIARSEKSEEFYMKVLDKLMSDRTSDAVIELEIKFLNEKVDTVAKNLGELNEDFKEFKKENKEDFKEMNNKVDNNHKEMGNKVETLRTEMGNRFDNNTKWIIRLIITMILGFSGVVIAILNLNVSG